MSHILIYCFKHQLHTKIHSWPNMRTPEKQGIVGFIVCMCETDREKGWEGEREKKKDRERWGRAQKLWFICFKWRIRLACRQDKVITPSHTAWRHHLTTVLIDTIPKRGDQRVIVHSNCPGSVRTAQSPPAQLTTMFCGSDFAQVLCTCFAPEACSEIVAQIITIGTQKFVGTTAVSYIS